MKSLTIAFLMAVAIGCTKPEPAAPKTTTKAARLSVDTTFSPAKSIAVTISADVTSGMLLVQYLAADSTVLHSDTYLVGKVGIGYTVYQVKPCVRFKADIYGTGNIISYNLNPQ